MLPGLHRCVLHVLRQFYTDISTQLFATFSFTSMSILPPVLYDTLLYYFTNFGLAR